MSGVETIHSHLEWLAAGDAEDPEHSYRLEGCEVEDWLRDTGLSRRQVLDTVAAWLAVGFNTGRLTFDFADAIANDLNHIALIAAKPEDLMTDCHTPLSWEVYLAFDAGEFVWDPDVDPVERNTRPLVADVVERLADLIEYRGALTELRSGGSAATCAGDG